MKKVATFILSLSMLLMSCSMFDSKTYDDAQTLDAILVASSQGPTGSINELLNTLIQELTRAHKMQTKIDTIVINQKIREGIKQVGMAKLLLLAGKEVDPKINYKQATMDYYDGCMDLLNNDFPALVKEIQDENITNDELIIIGDRIIDIWGKMLKMMEQIKNVEHTFAAKYDIKKSGDPWNLKKQKASYNKARAGIDKAKKDNGIE